MVKFNDFLKFDNDHKRFYYKLKKLIYNN